MWLLCMQGSYYYYIIQGLDAECPTLEQTSSDGDVNAERWTSRTAKVSGDQRGHSPRSRVQFCLEQPDRSWVHIEECPVYYVTLIKAKERLEGLDHLVATNLPQVNTKTLFGRLRGATARVRLEWALQDLGLDINYLPEFPRQVSTN
jgi:hypothetical protein